MPDEPKAPDEESEDEGGRVDDKGKSLMHVKLYSPFRVYYDDSAYSVSAENDTGPFDILPRHHNFMTLLSTGEVIIQAPNGEQKVKITRGVMHVKKDEVIIFLDV